MSVANPAPQQAASTQAVLALVVGILSLVTCCGLPGPLAWYLGYQETKAIREGLSPAAGQGFAQAGMILGIIASIFLTMGVFWIFFMGGMAILSAMFHH
jgi:hypothetical protein